MPDTSRGHDPLRAPSKPGRSLTERSWTLWARDAGETVRLGRALGCSAAPGSVLLLTGALGAGKTTLVQGLAAGLGVSERVTSPTFVLVHEHRLAGQPRDPAPDRLIHVDLYRVAAAAAADLGVADTAAEAGVLVVEWAERARGLFGADALEATLEIVPAGRRIAFAPGGPLSAAWLRRALEDLTIADLERDGGEAEA